MQVIQTRRFQQAAKKLKPNQKHDLDEAVRILLANPILGEPKRGDLAWLRVYKFRMVNQLTLLAYTFEEEKLILTLLAVGSHENFYRDLK
jgi:mRNA-degrading endonuclease RelE of RelBE toxin-antitoxin system